MTTHLNMTPGQVTLMAHLQPRGALSKLSAKTGLHTATLRAIQGGQSPTVDQAVAFEQALGIPLNAWIRDDKTHGGE